MKKANWLVVLLAMLIAASFSAVSFAADEAAAPYINAQTDLVIHVDLSKLDMDAITTWWLASMDNSKVDKAQLAQMKADVTQHLATAKDWLAKYKKAGGKDAYGVMAFNDILTGGGVVIMPLGEGADSDALIKLMSSDGSGPTGTVIGKNLVLGTPQALEKLKTVKATTRPDLTDALAVNPDAQVHVAVSASILASINMLSQQGPDSFINNFKTAKWGTIAVTAPPKAAINATIQCNDAAAATVLAAALNVQIDKMKEDAHAKEMFGEHLDKLTAALKPTATDNKLSITLDQDLITALWPTIGQNGLMPFGVVAVQPTPDGTTRPTPPAMEEPNGL